MFVCVLFLCVCKKEGEKLTNTTGMIEANKCKLKPFNGSINSSAEANILIMTQASCLTAANGSLKGDGDLIECVRVCVGGEGGGGRRRCQTIGKEKGGDSGGGSGSGSGS